MISQCCFVIPAAMENANNRHHVFVDRECNDGAPIMVRDAQTGPYIVTRNTTVRKILQTLAGLQNATDVTLGDSRGGGSGNVVIQAEQLRLGFRRKDEPKLH